MFFWHARTTQLENLFSQELSLRARKIKHLPNVEQGKEKTSDCYCLFKRDFGLLFGQKQSRKDSNNHKSFLFIERCELIVAAKYIGSRVVGKCTQVVKRNIECSDFG